MEKIVSEKYKQDVGKRFKRSLRTNKSVFSYFSEQIRDRVSYFFDKVFNAPVKPYRYVLKEDLYYKVLNYFIADENCFISRDGNFSFLIKTSDYFDFISYISSEEFLKLSKDVTVHINLVTDISDSVAVSNMFVTFSLNLGFSYETIDRDLAVFEKFRSFVCMELDKNNIEYDFSDVGDLLRILEKIVGFENIKYKEDVPLGNLLPFSNIVLRDELFYSKKDLFFNYTLKSHLYSDIGKMLKELLCGIDFTGFGFYSPMVSNIGVVLKKADKKTFSVLVSNSVRNIDGVSFYKDSNFFKKDEYGLVDFSGYVKEIDFRVIKSLSEYGFVFQREQKNFNFMTYMFNLPLNFPNFNEEERDFLGRFFYISPNVVQEGNFE